MKNINQKFKILKKLKNIKNILYSNNTPLEYTNSPYNNNSIKLHSHNCYSYVLDLLDPEARRVCYHTRKNNKNELCHRSQPGYSSGFPYLKSKDHNCPEIMKRTLSDNKHIYRIGKYQTCKKTHYPGALVVAPKRDYHYYRKDDGSVLWSHKPGAQKVTRKDSRGNLIYYPDEANRNNGRLNYKDFCGYFCVPRNKSKKNMAYKPKIY